MENKTHRLVIIALYTALALILSYLESLVPIPMPVPGAKVGLPNIVTLLSLLTLGAPLTVLIITARIFLSGFLFGSMSAILYALAGGYLSLGVMTLLLKTAGKKLSLITVSVLGAVSHNLGQLIVAAAVVQNINLFWSYLPFLMLLAVPTGIVVGVAADLLYRQLKKINLFK
ncbi:Gx transporter family protein [Eubacterium sp. 1001713B170207_170306_E7]|uniref:Gx transporter family protein n=1 Tax=Eubacterium sp. 1001713B170207_170306_E7 TaxID=2787097 RepID=UPI0018983D95|nr:Gx transporter family protein [Eubacterium sp. 1001713B170207_170306_E7]